MTQQKSPTGQGRAKNKKHAEQAASFYPASLATVNLCASCGYFHPSSKRRWRSFCMLTGEDAPETSRCDFWTARAITPEERQ